MHSFRFLSFSTVLFLATRSALADGLQDLLNLKQSLIYGQTLMQANVNNTGLFDTSGVLENVTNNILASKARLDADPVAFKNGTAPDAMGSAYIFYIAEVPTLASLIISRGRAWHGEWNQPVYSALQALARTIHAYGNEMAQQDLINTDGTLRTIRAGASVVSAQRSWSGSVNYPGRKRAFVG